VGALRPWQIVFLSVGLPGLLVAVWTATLREPERRSLAGDCENPDAQRPSLAETLSYLWTNVRALGGVYLCMAFAAMTSYSIGAWAVSFLSLTYDLSIEKAGHDLGPVLFVSGALGAVTGGLLGDAVSARGVSNGRLRVMACAALAGVPFAAAAPLASTAQGAMLLLAPLIFFDAMIIGLGPSTLLELVPNRIRGTATSIGVLIVNVIGLGVGPLAIGLATNLVFVDAHGYGLRSSLALLLPCMLAVSAAFGAAGLPHYRRSREALAMHRRWQ
jgi:MFS family permease